MRLSASSTAFSAATLSTITRVIMSVSTLLETTSAAAGVLGPALADGPPRLHVGPHVARDHLGGGGRGRSRPADRTAEPHRLGDDLAVRGVPVLVVHQVLEKRHRLLERARHVGGELLLAHE